MKLPLRGSLAKTFGPKYPINHNMSRITTIVYSIEKLLLIDLSYNSSYDKHTPAASIGWGVFVSATWGRQNKLILQEQT
jgi:hypothetical protein